LPVTVASCEELSVSLKQLKATFKLPWVRRGLTSTSIYSLEYKTAAAAAAGGKKKRERERESTH
jgi:hypothetical protein